MVPSRMVFSVRVIPNAGKMSVTEENGCLKVRLTKPAIEGRANKQLVEALSDYFAVKKYRIKIIRGETSRNKVVEIL